MDEARPARLIVGITGATGTIFGVRLLQMLQGSGVETHLVVSKWAARTLAHETPYTLEELQQMATHHYPLGNQGAAISSGSFVTLGMVVIPCSMRTLSAVANGAGDNLIHRAADVVLKERRRLVLLFREAPLHMGHIRAMAAATENGAIVFPPVPAFYDRPASLHNIVDHTVGRVLDLFGFEAGLVRRWTGRPPAATRGLVTEAVGQ